MQRASSDLWIAANDQASEGAWLWAATGEPFWRGDNSGRAVPGQYAHWSFGEPNNLLNSDCGVLSRTLDSGKWRDEPCSSSRAYVCEPVADACPNDPNKARPGICGCGVADFDSDDDSTPDCLDHCPNDRQRTEPDCAPDGDCTLGSFGDCMELCPQDPRKQEPGVCGCGNVEADADFDGQPDCLPCLGAQLGAAWPMSGNCRDGAHRSTFVGAQVATQNWSVALSPTARSAPAQGAGGIVYVGAADGLHAYSAGGTPLWTANTPAPVRTSAALDSAGRAFFASDDGSVRAVTASSGQALWSVQTGNAVRASPVLGVDGAVIVANGAGLISALDANDGHLLWSYQLGGAVSASAAVARDGRIYIGALDGLVYALRPEPGLTAPARLVWSSDLAAAISGAVTLNADASALYAGNEAGRLVKLRTADGSVSWEFATEGAIVASAAVGALHFVYVGSNDGNVYALQDEASQVSELWRFATGPLGVDLAIGGDGTLYVGSTQMFALRPLPDTSPRVLWQLPLPGGVFSAASVASSGAILVASPEALSSIGGYTASGCEASEVCASYLGVNFCASRVPGMPFTLPAACPESGICPNQTPCTELLDYRFCFTPCTLPTAAH